jgi:hypothetical protein
LIRSSIAFLYEPADHTDRVPSGTATGRRLARQRRVNPGISDRDLDVDGVWHGSVFLWRSS